MKVDLLVIFIVFISLFSFSSSVLVDGIATLSWSPIKPAIDRFLTSNTHIKLTILCREPTVNASVTREQIKQKKYKTDKEFPNAKIHIRGRIGLMFGCLRLQSDPFLSKSQKSNFDQKDNSENQRASLLNYYTELWREMEVRTFAAHLNSCEHDTELFIDELSIPTAPRILPKGARRLRQEQLKSMNTPTAAEEKKPGKIVTWEDGYYIIEIYQPSLEGIGDKSLDVDVVVAMKNRYGGYITADEYPTLVFYDVMRGIYALFAILWVVCCAFNWRELLAIQFCIGGVILIGMVEKCAFVIKYDILNRQG